jgi:hypothetical protein
VQGEQLGRDHGRCEQDGGWAREPAQALQLDGDRRLCLGKALQQHGDGCPDEAVIDGQGEMRRDPDLSRCHCIGIGTLDGVDQRRHADGDRG